MEGEGFAEDEEKLEGIKGLQVAAGVEEGRKEGRMTVGDEKLFGSFM